MKLYVVESGTPCCVVENVMAEDAKIKAHVTRTTFEDHTFLMAPGSVNSPTANRCTEFGWNKDMLKGVVRSVNSGHYIFTRKNRNGDQSLLIVNKLFVEVIC